jgi:hypothetical protein
MTVAAKWIPASAVRKKASGLMTAAGVQRVNDLG